MPFNWIAKALFIMLICITGVLVAYSVGVSIWSLIGEEGWVTKSAWAVFCWFVTSPFLLGLIVWSIVLSTTKKARKAKFLERTSVTSA